MTSPPVTLRPRDEDVPLDRIVLIIQEGPGTRITGTSKATAFNADGVSDGSLCIQVRNTPLPVSELVHATTLTTSDDCLPAGYRRSRR